MNKIDFSEIAIDMDRKVRLAFKHARSLDRNATLSHGVHDEYVFQGTREAARVFENSLAGQPPWGLVSAEWTK